MSTAQNKKYELELKKLKSKMHHEIENAYSQGTKLGIYYTINIILYILYDKSNYTKEQLQSTYNEFISLLKTLSDEEREYLKVQDIIEVLKEECDIVVNELTIS